MGRGEGVELACVAHLWNTSFGMWQVLQIPFFKERWSMDKNRFLAQHFSKQQLPYHNRSMWRILRRKVQQIRNFRRELYIHLWFSNVFGNPKAFGIKRQKSIRLIKSLKKKFSKIVNSWQSYHNPGLSNHSYCSQFWHRFPVYFKNVWNFPKPTSIFVCYRTRFLYRHPILIIINSDNYITLKGVSSKV